MNNKIFTILMVVGVFLVAGSMFYESKVMDELGLYPVQITGEDMTHIADVLDDNGVKRLQVSMTSSGGGNTSVSKFYSKKRFYEFLMNSETTPKKTMFQDCDNGSYTSDRCIFDVEPHPTDDVVIQQVRCFARCDNVKFTHHICDEGQMGEGLDDGLVISYKTENEVYTFPTIHFTEDWKNFFAYPGVSDSFRIDQGSEDQLVAIYRPETSFLLKAQGTYGAGNDDYIKVELSDDMKFDGSNVDDPDDDDRPYLNCVAEGYRI